MKIRGFKTLVLAWFILMTSTAAYADLVVIDMQPFFLNRGGISEIEKAKLLQRITSKIEKAKTHNDYIIIVEYKSNRFHSDKTYGSESSVTHHEILKAIEGYEKILHVTKDEDDGSTAIKRALDQRGLTPEAFDVCGVNTGFCVKSTVEGLTRIMESINVFVHSDACQDGNGDRFHHGGLKYMSFLPNVSIAGTSAEFKSPILRSKFSEASTYLESKPFDVSYSAAAFEMLESLLKLEHEQEQPIRSQILGLLENSDARVRASVARVIGAFRSQNPELLSKLASLLTDPSPAVRVSAANALGDIGTNDPTVHLKLSHLLDDAIPEVRSSAALSLGAIQFRNSKVHFSKSESEIMQFPEEVQARREILQMDGVEKVQKAAELSLKMVETLFAPPSLISPDQLNPFGLSDGKFSLPQPELAPLHPARPVITSLIKAVRYGTPEQVANEIESGADVNEKDVTGTDALHYAEFKGDLNMVHALLQSGKIPKEVILNEVEYLRSFIRRFPDSDHSQMKTLIPLFEALLSNPLYTLDRLNLPRFGGHENI